MDRLPVTAEVLRFVAVRNPESGPDSPVIFSHRDLDQIQVISIIRQHWLNNATTDVALAATGFIGSGQYIGNIDSGRVARLFEDTLRRLRAASLLDSGVDVYRTFAESSRAVAADSSWSQEMRTRFDSILGLDVWASFVCAVVLNNALPDPQNRDDAVGQRISTAKDWVRLWYVLSTFASTSLPPLPDYRQFSLVDPWALRKWLSADVCVPRDLLAAPNSLLPQPRVLGVGDLKLVRKQLLRYVPGEIAHIENVLKGEEKIRNHRRTERIEESVETTTEESTETERDLQSTDRLELTQEVTQTVKRDEEAKDGLSITGRYGAVSLTANSNRTSTSSRENSQQIARRHAHDVVSRSVDRLTRKVVERRTTHTYVEVVEENTHKLDGGVDGSVGLYRWVDQVFQAQVVNYGARLMVEFMIPEPAAFYKETQGSTMGHPQEVPAPIYNGQPVTVSSIDRNNYASILAAFGVDPAEHIPPPTAIELSAHLNNTAQGDDAIVHAEHSLDFADYNATQYWITGVVLFDGFPDDAEVVVSVGDTRLNLRPDANYMIADSGTVSLIGNTLISMFGSATVRAASITVKCRCALRPEKLQSWTHQVYSSIQKAYLQRLDEFKAINSAAMSQVMLRESELREIERSELRRWCVEMIAKDYRAGFGPMQGPSGAQTFSDFDHALAGEKGAIAKFFEETFEWDQLTYIFFPFFWARKEQWRTMVGGSNGDALFTKFLNAGYARVVVPIGRGHENAFLYFLSTRAVWHGGEVPIIQDPLFISLANSLREQETEPADGVPEGEPWEVNVPTTLVVLQQGDTVPALPDFTERLSATRRIGRVGYAPSSRQCGQFAFDANRWPDDGFAMHREYIALGYALPSTGEPLQDMASSVGRRAIKAFQSQMRTIDPASSDLAISGENDACTRIALDRASVMRQAHQWPGPGSVTRGV